MNVNPTYTHLERQAGDLREKLGYTTRFPLKSMNCHALLDERQAFHGSQHLL